MVNRQEEWFDWLDKTGKLNVSYETWLKKAYPIKSKPKPKPKPKKTPQSKRHMYPPPKTKKSLRPTSAQINSYFDKKKAGKKKNAANASVKKRLEMEKKLADSSAKISSRRVQSPSLKAELAKKENAKKIASQRKNLMAQQQKRKDKQRKNIIFKGL